MREVLDDAVDMALRDQEDADIDIVTDGEMRRLGFFTAEFYRHLTGLKPLEPDRKSGMAGHDQQHRFEVLEPIAAPNGLGVVAEFEYARARTRRPLKVTLPGPFTLAGRLMIGSVYPTRADAAWAFVPLLKRELETLVQAGADFIQIDEPSPAIHPDSPAEFAALFNAAVDGVVGKVRLATHLCFGNYAGRPLARRTYAPVLDEMLRFHVDQFVLEFANREMAQLDLCQEIARHADIAAGVVDVKSYYLESAEDVAERVRQVLAFVPPERLSLVPDCGFSQTARWAARSKLHALSGGARLVRAELQAGA
jgi:5-methyltetrahydropteroyltriglutamate--homocysteine methyltransferase